MNFLQGLLLGVHILGATIWVGGSVVLGMATMVLSRDREGGAGRIPELGRRVVPLLWTVLAAPVATGLDNLRWYVPPGTGWTSWVGPPEGPILLAKLILVSVMVAARPSIRSSWGRASCPSGGGGARRRACDGSPGGTASWPCCPP